MTKTEDSSNKNGKCDKTKDYYGTKYQGKIALNFLLRGAAEQFDKVLFGNDPKILCMGNL